jgi:hypothetical protein
MEARKNLSNVWFFGAWGFTLVFTSMLFLYAGIWIDGMLKTAPNFTFGLFFLAVFMCITRLYRDAWKKKEDF